MSCKRDEPAMKGFLLPGVLAGGVVSGGVQQKVSTNSEVMKLSLIHI